MVFEKVRRPWHGPLHHGGTRDTFAKSFQLKPLEVDIPTHADGTVWTVRIRRKCNRVTMTLQTRFSCSVGTWPARSRTPSSKSRCWMSLSTASHLVPFRSNRPGPEGLNFKAFYGGPLRISAAGRSGLFGLDGRSLHVSGLVSLAGQASLGGWSLLSHGSVSPDLIAFSCGSPVRS